ncbi:MAG: Dyp-type peroxidase [Pseudomonadota bacterium]
MKIQPGILLDVPKHARYLTFVITNHSAIESTLKKLSQLEINENLVLGLGIEIITSLNKEVPNLKRFPIIQNTPIESHQTAGDLWCWLRGDDRGELLHKGRELELMFEPAFKLFSAVDGFKYMDGRDLTGYEDGTENPEGEEAIKAAFVDNSDEHINGSSYVAVQQWRHDLNYFESLSKLKQDQIIGRERISNEEMEDAPKSAHVKRTEQESFDPEAFVLRRSMPWSENQQAGLIFVAFGKSFEAFESLWQRMVGAEDSLSDAMFTISEQVTGNYYWCPPIKNGLLDLTHIFS